MSPRRGVSSRSTSCASWRTGTATRSRTATSTPAPSLTFAEWDEQSNRLARFLVRPGRRARRPGLDLPAERRGAALDRHLRRDAQGRRDRGADQHPPVGARARHDPRSRRGRRVHHLRRRCSTTRSRCATSSRRSALVVTAGGGDGHRRSTTTTRCTTDGSDIQVPTEHRRPRRHHVHVGHDRPARRASRSATATSR